MKNITLSAGDELIEQARPLARAQKRSLDEPRGWLVRFTEQAGRAEEYDRLINDSAARFAQIDRIRATK